ncbi:MAG TPA: outer membrane protein transport protein [Labilithrix sp.]|nr:outer membrane protein transport protein [Labilithrix sp.]
MRKLAVLALGVAVGVLAQEGNAHASTELPAPYDARSVGLGGTGISYIENGASVFHNPAALDGIRKFAGTAAFTGFIATVKAPVLGPRTSLESETAVNPLFLLGAGYRLSDRFVVGLGVYPTIGFGGEFKLPANQRLSLTVAKFELAPAVSFRIIDGLSLGLSYRITHTRQTFHSPAQPPVAPGAPPTPEADVSLTGTNFFGLQAGAYYRPIEPLHVGLTFRTQVGGAMTGTTETAGQTFDTRAEFGSPARLGLGISYKLIQQLMLTADAKYLFYSGTTDALRTTVQLPAQLGGPQTTTTPFNWKNVPAFGLGVEYWPIEMLAVRGGYSLTKSATPESTASALTPAPGWMHGGHLGVGLKVSDLQIDVGGSYLVVSTEVNRVAPPPPAPGQPGEYKINAFLASASATYAF